MVLVGQMEADAAAAVGHHEPGGLWPPGSFPQCHVRTQLVAVILTFNVDPTLSTNTLMVGCISAR